MRQYYKDIVWGIGLVAVVSVFFYKFFFSGLVPVPTDTLIGMYHPYRDAYLHEYTQGVPFKNFLITDPVRQQIPWRKQVIDYWKNGLVPSWDPFSFSGTTLVGNIQAGSFYPLNILFFLFSFPVAWTFLVMSQPILASLFLYVFLRNKNLSPVPSSIGALCFAFGGYATAWLTWGTIGSTFLWVPLMFLSVDKIHTSVRKWPWRVIFLFAVSSSFFAGHIQLFIYGFLCVLWYLWWTNKNTTIKFSMWHILLASALIILTLPQWFPLLKFLPQSARGTIGANWTAEGFFIPVKHLVQFLIPDYFGNPTTLNYWGTWNYGEMVGYIGIIGLVLAMFGIGKNTLVWIVPLITAFLFAVQSPVSVLPFRFSFPIVSIFQPTRLLAVVSLSLSILAAYGAKRVENISWKKFGMVLGGAALLFVGIWASALFPAMFHITPEHAMVMKRNVYLPSLIFLAAVILLSGIAAAKKIRIASRFFWMCLLVVSIFDLFRFGWKFTPFTGQSYFFPETQVITLLEQQRKPFRVMVLDDRALPPNVLSYYGIESVSGYDPIHESRYEEFIASMERGNGNITPPFGFDRIMTPKNINSPLFDLLNISYVVSMTPINDSRFKVLLEEGQTILYKNSDVLPRAYVVQNVTVKNGKQEIIDTINAPEFSREKTAVVETPVVVSDTPIDETDRVDIINYTNTGMTITSFLKGDRFLVIGNIFDEGWQATVDGTPTVLYRTNYLFQGIIVPAGEHEIQLNYSAYR